MAAQQSGGFPFAGQGMGFLFKVFPRRLTFEQLIKAWSGVHFLTGDFVQSLNWC